ncbi:hypothetical protein [Clostridium algidicarnis]|uniref:hypothetical protein n=1 Tax=Clostridium algidicarnis TaxID=37659 RepID=UPI001C0CA63D|nr:hypothetical protein [Clostridium algidicarnis]MBU3196893.1 hypothetical protein [Clostridium algidicarnis]MBU3210207.1 hypothetical protein [Clostridium algidicarnis]MBU3227962.1 hypothetical protein [Clostridium algidicarnis]MBU3251712.1 hypothetical protein [Clostridium algidicarnis]
MKIMYKEVVTRRKTPFIAAMLLGLVIMIVISNIVEQIKISNYEIGFITNPVLFVITAMVIILELIKCRVKYKYSIIANQLIIHRLKNNNQSVVENVKIEDIVFIGKTKDIKGCINKNIKKTLNSISAKRYVCSMSMFNQYCCIYKYGDKYKRFYFEPSIQFLNKIKVN